jgi:hypothetical protein
MLENTHNFLKAHIRPGPDSYPRFFHLLDPVFTHLRINLPVACQRAQFSFGFNQFPAGLATVGDATRIHILNIKLLRHHQLIHSN